MGKRPKRVCNQCGAKVRKGNGTMTMVLHPDFPPPLCQTCCLYVILSRKLRFVAHGQKQVVSTHDTTNMGN